MLLDKLSTIWQDCDDTFLIYDDKHITFSAIATQITLDLSLIQKGDVVALVGDFTPANILILLRLIDLGAIIVPLTKQTEAQHPYFFESAFVDVVIKDAHIKRRAHAQSHPLIETLRVSNNPGLVFFSSGTTGKPKAILHDFSQFLARFDTPKPSFSMINFLLFDHVGGINTLFHALFSKSIVVAPSTRSVDSILLLCKKHQVQVLPTTPTFLRLLLLSGALPQQVPECLKVITYGTELMDQSTLNALCKALPNVDFRQTFGMSELGIVRVKSESRDSLFMQIGGQGIETQVRDNVLYIRSKARMLGYLNADDPFDENGWYNTHDIVECKQHYYKVLGRKDDVINVGGLKFMASDVENVALQYPEVALVKVLAKRNPITGQHVEMSVQATDRSSIDKAALMTFLQSHLQAHMVPKRIKLAPIQVGHRFKKS